MASSAPSVVLCDSLDKVFTDGAPRPMNTSIPYSVFLGEAAGFQLAIHCPDDAAPLRLRLDLDDASARHCTLSEVVAVPCQAVTQEFDAHYVRTETGRYPDLLRPLPDGVVTYSEPGWHAIWVELRVTDFANAGPHPVTVTLSDEHDVIFEQTVLIHVLPRQLPPLPIAHTEWFHVDCLADYYGVPVFSEEHWQIIDRFMASAAKVDVTTLLTPTWTPPLDTAVGSYRTPVQLIGITRTRGRYAFDFSRLHRWLDMCRSHGIRQVEIPHFFTQWGAQATPAIYATVDGRHERIFGWDVPASDPRYAQFVEALIPQLLEVLSHAWSLDRVCFHISDEPTGAEQRESYRAARDVVAPLLAGLTIIDALSDIDYWREGLVHTPVAATSAIEPFLEAHTQPLWTYYCVAQQKDVSNRFITLPSIRTRILAPQIYTSGVSGFLHWGFNFYYSELSARLIHPFHDTTAGGAFPGGDSFLVYPGDDGVPWESLRYRVLAAAMADLRAMALLERLHGRERVLEILRPEHTLRFSEINYDADAYRHMRERLNAAIMAP